MMNESQRCWFACVVVPDQAVIRVKKVRNELMKRKVQLAAKKELIISSRMKIFPRDGITNLISFFFVPWSITFQEVCWLAHKKHLDDVQRNGTNFPVVWLCFLVLLQMTILKLELKGTLHRSKR